MDLLPAIARQREAFTPSRAAKGAVNTERGGATGPFSRSSSVWNRGIESQGEEGLAAFKTLAMLHPTLWLRANPPSELLLTVERFRYVWREMLS